MRQARKALHELRAAQDASEDVFFLGKGQGFESRFCGFGRWVCGGGGRGVLREEKQGWGEAFEETVEEGRSARVYGWDGGGGREQVVEGGEGFGLLGPREGVVLHGAEEVLDSGCCVGWRTVRIHVSSEFACIFQTRAEIQRWSACMHESWRFLKSTLCTFFFYLGIIHVMRVTMQLRYM